MSVARLGTALLVVFTLLWGSRADAATVAILRPAHDAPELDEAVFRLQGELLAVGLAVALSERPPSEDTRSEQARAWFEQRSRESGIDAFIDVVGERTPVAVDVWLCEREPRRLKVSRVVPEPNAQNASAALAIRAIEVLRSSFLALELAGPRPAQPPPERPRVTERSPSPDETAGASARIGLAAGAAALASLDGVGPSIVPLLRLDWAASSWLALEATAAGFGTRPRVESDAGSVQVAQEFLLLGLCACRSSAAGFRPVVALAAGALHTALDGRATLPNVGHQVAQWSFLLDASVGLRLNVPGRYYVTLASHAQLAQPYVAIHSANEVVATTGRPNLGLTLTAGAWL